MLRAATLGVAGFPGEQADTPADNTNTWSLNYGRAMGMHQEKAGSRLVVIIVAAVVLLALLGLLIYLCGESRILNRRRFLNTLRQWARSSVNCAELLHAAERLNCEINCQCFDAFTGSPLGRL